MRIREKHPVKDRINLLLVLLLVLFVLVIIAKMKTVTTNGGSIENLLRTALEPVGSTMYIWGGGWDDTDKASGTSSTLLGLRPEWKEFASMQKSDYDYKNYRFEREKGLDCSGYVGWVLYNTFEKKDGQQGYVTTSTLLAESLAERGWGKLILEPEKFLPGDIVSMEGHVWICLGTCEDGSVLLVHSSPPGVSVCGTSWRKASDKRNASQNVKEKSIAITLAEEYMKTHHPNWQEKYPNRYVGDNYLENVQVFRWNENRMSDAKELQGLSAEKVMERITGFYEYP